MELEPLSVSSGIVEPEPLLASSGIVELEAGSLVSIILYCVSVELGPLVREDGCPHALSEGLL